MDGLEKERIEQRFVSRAKALSFVRLALFSTSQSFFFEPLWAPVVLIGFLLSYFFAADRKWGRLLVFLTLNIDLAWLGFAIAHTGFFHSPLIATVPALTSLFVTLFHKPFVILPPLLILPILTSLDPDVSIEILALYSLLNACMIYLTNKILGEEEATSYRILKLEQALKKQAVIEERHRLSRDIHDGVGSVLSALALQAEQLDSFEIRNLAREALQETRYAVSIMRNDLDLSLQIQNQADLFSRRHQIKIELKIPDELSEISNSKALSILRILQESLTNVAKHAQASLVQIEACVKQNRLLLDIKDNGVGFDSQHIPKNHYGIRNIEERVREMGGTFQIDSSPHMGTSLQIGANL